MYWFKSCRILSAALLSALLLLSTSSILHARQGMSHGVGVLLFRVSRLYSEEKYSEAAALIRKFRAQNNDAGDSPELLFALGNCCLAMKDYRCALTSYRQVVSIRPDHGPAWQNMANAQYNLQQYGPAATSFLRAFELQKEKDPDLLYYSGMCYLLSGDGHKATEVFQRLFDSFRGKIEPQWKEGMVRALIACGRNRRAIPLIEELVAGYTGEKKKQWGELLLYQYVQMKMYKKAHRLALELARLFPADDHCWKAVAHVALELGKTEDALAAMMIVSFIRPLNDREARLLADLNLQVGIPQKALVRYESLLEARPSPTILQYAVYACRALGQPERALSLLDTYRKIAGKSLSLLMARADILYGLSRYRSALHAYECAAQFRGKSVCRHDRKERGRAWLMAGYCALQIQEYKKAHQAFTKAAGFPALKNRAVEARKYVEKVLKLS